MSRDFLNNMIILHHNPKKSINSLHASTVTKSLGALFLQPSGNITVPESPLFKMAEANRLQKLQLQPFGSVAKIFGCPFSNMIHKFM